MTYEWLFSRVELLVKKQHDADATVFDRDVVVKIDFEKTVIGASSSKRCRVSGCFFTLLNVFTKKYQEGVLAVVQVKPRSKKAVLYSRTNCVLDTPQIEAVSPLLEEKLTAC